MPLPRPLFCAIVGRLFRRWLLGDTIRDTGCSLRIMKREIALALPLEFKGMHRFIPVTARHLGYTVVEMPVNHRPRVAGQTKYGLGRSNCSATGLVAVSPRPVASTTCAPDSTTRRAARSTAGEIRPCRSMRVPSMSSATIRGCHPVAPGVGPS